MITNVVVEKYLQYERLIEVEALHKINFLMNRNNREYTDAYFDCIDDGKVFIQYTEFGESTGTSFPVEYLWLSEKEIDDILTKKENERKKLNEEIWNQKLKEAKLAKEAHDKKEYERLKKKFAKRDQNS